MNEADQIKRGNKCLGIQIRNSPSYPVVTLKSYFFNALRSIFSKFELQRMISCSEYSQLSNQWTELRLAIPSL